MLVGVPAAVIADRTSRSVVLQAAAAMIVLAIAGTTAAVSTPVYIPPSPMFAGVWPQ